MNRTTCGLAPSISEGSQVDQTVSRAHLAQGTLVAQDDHRIEMLITAIAKRVLQNSKHLAELEMQETGMGNAADKAHKLTIVCGNVVRQICGAKTYGRIAESQDGIVEFASPVGVVFGIVPSTNPVPNSLFKIFLCLKTRNALILSFPKTVTHLTEVVMKIVSDAFQEFGLPLDLVQHVKNPDRKLVQDYLRHPNIDLVLATGGAALVKEAHSSGNPCYGVGPGNVPVYVAADANLPNAATQIVASKSYDNGIICGSENNLVVDESIYQTFLGSLIQQSAAILSPDEKHRAMREWFRDDGVGLRRELLGRTAYDLAMRIGVSRDYKIRTLVIPAEDSEAPILGVEKLAPILALFRSSKEKAIDQCVRLLVNQGGAGHTAVIHTEDRLLAEQFAARVPAGRILVNTPATFGMMGVTTELPVAFMIGSGTWGGNITTEAITWRHLVNVKRLAWGTQEMEVKSNF